MKNKSLFKFIAVLMLAISFTTIPTIDFLSFLEPAIAAAKKKSKKKNTKKKTAKKKTTKQKSSSNQNVVMYRCARCGEWWLKGADPRIDFVYQLSQCKYGGMHVWRRIK